MIAAEVLHTLLTKAGVSSEISKQITTTVGLDKIDMGEDANKLTSLMNFAEAKANPEVRDYYAKKHKADYLDTVDKLTNAFSEKLELTDEEKGAYATKTTYQRLEYLTELYDGKKTALLSASGTDKKKLQEEYQKQIEAIRGQIKQVQEQADREKADFTNRLSDFQYNNILGAIKYDTKGLPEQAIKLTHKQLVDEYIKQKGAKMVFDGERFVLKNAAAPDLDYLENGQTVNFADIVTKVAAENKLLAVSGGQQQQQQQQRVGGLPPKYDPKPNEYIGNETASQALADLRAGK